MQTQVQIVNGQLVPVAKVARKPRYPKHRFYVEHRPWQIQPFMLAPVLAGETLDLGLLQCRAVTHPIKNPLVGWWLEHHFFYVKLRDLDVRDSVDNMVMDTAFDIDSVSNDAADVLYHHNVAGVNWTKHCLKRVVEEFFRNEGETWDAVTIGGLPVASIGDVGWLDSALLESALPEGTAELDADTQEDIERKRQQFEFMREMKFLDKNATFEDYLVAQGITGKAVEELHVPELIRSLADWQYPSNTVNPADGVPASAVSWSIQESIRKDRFFTEPGFILGVTVAKPKVYLKNLRGTAAHQLKTAFDWLPAAMRDEVYTSLKTLAAADSPLSGMTVDHIVDVRDIFIHGDQFTNLDQATASGYSEVNLPTADLASKWYAASADADALFVSALSNKIRQDGVCRLTIKGKAGPDVTPRM